MSAQAEKTLWSDWMILESIEKHGPMTAQAFARAQELAKEGYIDATGTWSLTAKGHSALHAAENPCSHSHPPEVPSTPCGRVSEAREAFAVVERDVAAICAGREVGPLTSAQDVFDFVAPMVAKFSQEVFLTIALDIRGNPLGGKPYVVAMGQTDRVSVEVSDAIRPCLQANGAIFIHNHPSGEAKPSDADRKLTKDLKAALRTAAPQCAFVDHVIVGGASRQYYSFANRKLAERGL